MFNVYLFYASGKMKHGRYNDISENLSRCTRSGIILKLAAFYIVGQISFSLRLKQINLCTVNFYIKVKPISLINLTTAETVKILKRQWIVFLLGVL